MLTSESAVRADVIRQFHERGDDSMVAVLTELEADEFSGWDLTPADPVTERVWDRRDDDGSRC